RYTPGKAWSTPSRPWTNTTNQNTTPATATTRPLALACAIGDPLDTLAAPHPACVMQFVLDHLCAIAPTRCDTPDTPTPPATANLPAHIEQTARTLPLPPAHLTLQPPGGTTLTGIPTILYTTTAQPHTHQLELLGHTITLTATPSSYTWNHGDGTHHTTTTPGHPYPHHDVTHTYTTTTDTPIHPSVDVAYTVTYHIDDGPEETLNTPITIPGTPTPLTITHATPTLSHPGA
ncbi:MAG: hypothetical protein QM621_10310, partial [Aeromicrobium sp.]|uniref:hypothetical protein n=1 Tax=Aeromicrobium sp. TaxID=1871063 RepID=UPI0039E561DC